MIKLLILLALLTIGCGDGKPKMRTLCVTNQERQESLFLGCMSHVATHSSTGDGEIEYLPGNCASAVKRLEVCDWKLTINRIPCSGVKSVYYKRLCAEAGYEPKDAGK